MIQRIVLLWMASILVGCAIQKRAVSEVFLLRHAEKQQDVADPGLTTAGFSRAARVAKQLQNQEIGYVFSTDYRRTRETAQVIADRFGLTVTIYDARQPQLLVDRVTRTVGSIVVVGHSNTIPDLVDRLGGQSGSAIDESEYDRLYRLRRGAVVATELLSSDI